MFSWIQWVGAIGIRGTGIVFIWKHLLQFVENLVVLAYPRIRRTPGRTTPITGVLLLVGIGHKSGRRLALELHHNAANLLRPVQAQYDPARETIEICVELWLIVESYTDGHCGCIELNVDELANEGINQAMWIGLESELRYYGSERRLIAFHTMCEIRYTRSKSFITREKASLRLECYAFAKLSVMDVGYPGTCVVNQTELSLVYEPEMRTGGMRCGVS